MYRGECRGGRILSQLSRSRDVLLSKLDLKMEADHDWSPDTRLQGCAGSLVADM